MRGYARAAANVARVMVNPPRVLYAAAAAAGAALFLWMFILVRFTSEWTLSGWMWRGMWPVLAMCVGLTVAISGTLRARWWSYSRWTQRRPRTPASTT